MRISARTRVFAVLGDPVSHSLSPRIQNAAFQAAGVDAVYVAIQSTADNLHAQMSALVRGGGGGNVTVPFKEVGARAPGARTPLVDLLRSANVFGGADGQMALDNTDVHGILTALESLGATSTNWCVIGTGGSARAAVGAARERGARIAVRSRDAARAAAFAEWAATIGVETCDAAECGIVINATPIGLSGNDVLPIDPAELPRSANVLDLVYRSEGPTPWVRACRSRGMPVLDGREVLLAQGAASWRVWLPGITPPIEIMRAALDGRLA